MHVVHSPLPLGRPFQRGLNYGDAAVYEDSKAIAAALNSRASVMGRITMHVVHSPLPLGRPFQRGLDYGDAAVDEDSNAIAAA